MRKRCAPGFFAILFALIVGLGVYKVTITQEKSAAKPEPGISEDVFRNDVDLLDLAENPAQPPADDKLTINIADLPDKTKIIGQLGLPLGSLVTVRGEFEGDINFDRFHVRVLNGKKFAGQAVFGSYQIFPFMRGALGNSGTRYQGDSYDWRFKIHGDTAFKIGGPGEQYEFVGVETGSQTLSRHGSLEVSSVMMAHQIPALYRTPSYDNKHSPQNKSIWLDFGTCFEVIALKRCYRDIFHLEN